LRGLFTVFFAVERSGAANQQKRGIATQKELFRIRLTRKKVIFILTIKKLL
jgi:hypothetical protein